MASFVGDDLRVRGRCNFEMEKKKVSKGEVCDRDENAYPTSRGTDYSSRWSMRGSKHCTVQQCTGRMCNIVHMKRIGAKVNAETSFADLHLKTMTHFCCETKEYVDLFVLLKCSSFARNDKMMLRL